MSGEPRAGKCKGRYQSLDLRNVRTLSPAYGQDRGSFVSTYKKENDISLLWPANLAKAQQEGLVSEATVSKLLHLFQSFQQSYQAAIKGFADEGLACLGMVKQAEDYGTLLDAICRDAKGDRNRENLLRPLLQIGSVIVEGGRVTAIVAPWHPLRISAMANKALQMASLLRHLLTAEDVFFGDALLFFKELKAELEHPYYPEIVLGWHDKKPEMLSLTDHHLDYSLHESPVISNDGYDDTNESPTETSTLIVELTKRFLSLYPHERANLSVVLYNCDSARLPYALVDKMNELHETRMICAAKSSCGTATGPSCENSTRRSSNRRMLTRIHSCPAKLRRILWRGFALASWPTKRRFPIRRTAHQRTWCSCKMSSPATRAWSGIRKRVCR